MLRDPVLEHCVTVSFTVTELKYIVIFGHSVPPLDLFEHQRDLLGIKGIE